MTGFDKKVLHVKSAKAAEFEVQVDFLGNGEWATYETLKTGAEGYRYHVFPQGFSAHWVRVVPRTTCTASAEFMYTQLPPQPPGNGDQAPSMRHRVPGSADTP